MANAKKTSPACTLRECSTCGLTKYNAFDCPNGCRCKCHPENRGLSDEETNAEKRNIRGLQAHTVYPWQANPTKHDGKLAIIGSYDKERDGHYVVCTTVENSEQDEVNARLIAAAPELLSRLRELGEAIEIGDPEEVAGLWVSAHNRIQQLNVVNPDDIEEEEESEDCSECLTSVENDAVCLCKLMHGFADAWDSDEEPWAKKAHQLINDYKRCNGVEQSVFNNVFISLCGWSFETLMK